MVEPELGVLKMFPCPTYRLDLVPINRSVGLKAKPTKPVTEVLRPVVAKYGLDLGSLLVRLVSVIWSLSTELCPTLPCVFFTISCILSLSFPR